MSNGIIEWDGDGLPDRRASAGSPERDDGPPVTDFEADAQDTRLTWLAGELEDERLAFSTPLGTATRPCRDFREHCRNLLPDCRPALDMWLESPGLRVAPAPLAAGARPVRIRRLPILFTAVSPSRPATWRPHRFEEGTGSGPPRLLATGSGGDLLTSGAIGYYDGWYHADARAFLDDRWRVFRLRSRPIGELASPRVVEAFAVRKARGGGPERPDVADPVAWLLAGAAAQAWEVSLERGWGPERLRCLAYLILTHMDLLGREATSELGAAGAMAARPPGLASILTRLLDRVNSYRLGLAGSMRLRFG